MCTTCNKNPPHQNTDGSYCTFCSACEALQPCHVCYSNQNDPNISSNCCSKHLEQNNLFRFNSPTPHVNITKAKTSCGKEVNPNTFLNPNFDIHQWNAFHHGNCRACEKCFPIKVETTIDENDKF